MREITDADFKAGLPSGVVLVDFYGTWCPPCKALEPVLEKLAGDFAGRAEFLKINIDDNTAAAVVNAVTEMPTVVVFRDGVEKSRFVGVPKEAVVAKALAEAMG